MFTVSTRKASAAVVSLALGATLAVAPVANAAQDNEANTSSEIAAAIANGNKDKELERLFSEPEVWGPMVGAVIGLPILIALSQAVIDFFGHTRF